MQQKGQNFPKLTNWLTWQSMGKERKDLTYLAPREWPHLTYLSGEDYQKLLDLQVSPLKALSDVVLKLVQRLLY